MGLKTLRDLRTPILEIIKLIRSDNLSLYTEHRFCDAFEQYFKQEDAEAVKRVISCPCDEIDDPCEVCQREIWFNNLTEEDLKEQEK